MGELNPAEIAAATPHPIKTSFDNKPGILWLIKCPMVPPND